MISKNLPFLAVMVALFLSGCAMNPTAKSLHLNPENISKRAKVSAYIGKNDDNKPVLYAFCASGKDYIFYEGKKSKRCKPPKNSTDKKIYLDTIYKYVSDSPPSNKDGKKKKLSSYIDPKTIKYIAKHQPLDEIYLTETKKFIKEVRNGIKRNTFNPAAPFETTIYVGGSSRLGDLRIAKICLGNNYNSEFHKYRDQFSCGRRHDSWSVFEINNKGEISTIPTAFSGTYWDKEDDIDIMLALASGKGNLQEIYQEFRVRVLSTIEEDKRKSQATKNYWNNIRQKPKKIGEQVCTFSNVYGYVEDVQGGKIKIYRVGIAPEKNGLFFSEISKSFNPRTFSSPYVWDDHTNWGSCSFSGD